MIFVEASFISFLNFSLTSIIPNHALIQLPIAGILGSLDEKIELNRKKIAELETLAKTIYDYWFVQFDFPDANGKPYKSSGGKMVWNEHLKRELPEGWACLALGELLANLKDGTHNPPSRVDRGVALLTGVMFGDMFLDLAKATYITHEDYRSIHSVYEPTSGDVIMTKIGTIGKINYLTQDDLPIAIHCNSALLQFLSPFKGPYSVLMCKSDSFQQRLRRAKGQSVQEFVNLERISSITVERPVGDIVEAFNKVASPIFSQLETLRQEINHISAIRNTILPLLMNGQVKVAE